MTKPDHQERLKGALQDFDKSNPGRALKGTHLMSIWNSKHPEHPLNEARARTVVAKVKQAMAALGRVLERDEWEYPCPRTLQYQTNSPPTRLGGLRTVPECFHFAIAHRVKPGLN
jgi:hypothetical protein